MFYFYFVLIKLFTDIWRFASTKTWKVFKQDSERSYLCVCTTHDWAIIFMSVPHRTVSGHIYVSVPHRTELSYVCVCTKQGSGRSYVCVCTKQDSERSYVCLYQTGQWAVTCMRLYQKGQWAVICMCALVNNFVSVFYEYIFWVLFIFLFFILFLFFHYTSVSFLMSLCWTF